MVKETSRKPAGLRCASYAPTRPPRLSELFGMQRGLGDFRLAMAGRDAWTHRKTVKKQGKMVAMQGLEPRTLRI